MRLLFVFIILLLSGNVYAVQIVTPTSWNNGDTVTAAKLNGNQNAITTVVNGNLDNTNMALGYKLFQVVSSLPSPGNQGNVAFLTSNNTLNLDNGSAWLSTVTPLGTLATGAIPYYNSGWQLLAPGSNGFPLVSNGTSSLPTYHPISLSLGITGTLAITNGGTGQTTANAALNALLPSQISNSGKFLTTNATSSSWTFIPSSQLAFQYEAAVGNAASTYGEIENSSLTAGGTVLYRYLTAPASVSLDEVLTGKYKKLAGSNTVTIYCQLWSSVADDMARGHFDIGGLTVNIDSGTVNIPTWYSGTIDVSSLSNNTVYDISIQLASVGATRSPRMGSIFMINS